MTGSPIANRSYDLWVQIDLLDDGATFGHVFASFQREVEILNDLGDERPESNDLSAPSQEASRNPTVRPSARPKEPSISGCGRSSCGSFPQRTSAILVRENISVLVDAEEMLKRLSRSHRILNWSRTPAVSCQESSRTCPTLYTSPMMRAKRLSCRHPSRKSLTGSRARTP